MSHLTNHEIYYELKKYEDDVPPCTNSTRKILEYKLQTYWKNDPNMFGDQNRNSISQTYISKWKWVIFLGILVLLWWVYKYKFIQ